MGKPTGFMEYTRAGDPERPPLERICDWDELHTALPDPQRRLQGARCMNCGVPYCQAGIRFEGQTLGCPLHNLIPEWNDMIMDGNYAHALVRLLKTNNFPEFTGRVCPHFCEQACICGIYGDPITVQNNELSIIEYAFAAGLMKNRAPKRYSGKKIAVIGSGPAGLAAADRLNRRGHSVTVFEKHEKAGGILMYGIPNMKLPKTVVQRRIDLMTEEGVVFRTGVDASDPETAKKILSEYDSVILCCGSEKPRSIGIDTAGVTGVYYAMEFLHAAVDRQQFGKESSVPSAGEKHVVIIGTGDTASDCAATAIRQGAASVVQLVRRPESDYLDCSGRLPADYAQEEASALYGKDPRVFGESVKELVTAADGKLTAVRTSGGLELPCDILIGATGFSGCDDKVCDAFGVEKGKNVITPAGSYRTNVEKVFTAGDMHRGQSLVVWAISEGRDAAREIDRYLMGYTNLI